MSPFCNMTLAPVARLTSSTLRWLCSNTRSSRAEAAPANAVPPPASWSTSATSSALQLIDRRRVYAARHGHLRTCERDEDDIT